MTRGKIVLDGKSKENLEKNCGIQFFFLVFLSFWAASAYPKLKQQQKILFRRRLALFEQKNMAPVLGKSGSVLRKSVTDFGKISHRLWENEPPTLRKSTTDFGAIRHRLWGNPSPTFGEICHRLWEESATDLGEICHRLWEIPPLTLGKSVTDFGEICHRL